MVEEKVKSIMSNLPLEKETVDTSYKMLNEKEASKYLKRSITTLWRLRNRGDLSYHKCGRQIFYRLDDLNKFIDKFTI